MTTTEFLARVLRFGRAYDLLPGEGLVLCAVSGGLDSMVLLHVLGALRETVGFQLAAAHYNHKLRGEESRRDADFVRRACENWGIPLFFGEGDVLTEAGRRGRGIEDCAREMRYAFLEETARAQGAIRIATAHHADDNLETQLLHLTRGAGLRGLAGMQPRRGLIVRPFLERSRAELAHYAQANNIPHVEDSSNADLHYRRNYLRHEVLPRLTELNPALVRGSVGALNSLREDQAFLEDLALAALRDVRTCPRGLQLPAKKLAEQPRPVAMRMQQQLLERLDGPQLSRSHLEAVLALAQSEKSSGQVDLPEGFLARREYESLQLCRGTQAQTLTETALLRDGVTELPLWRVHCRSMPCPPRPEADTLYVKQSTLGSWPHLRGRREGDRLALPKRRDKSLKRLLIDEKIPRWQRDSLPLLADERGVIAVAGLGADRSRTAEPGEAALALRFEHTDREERHESGT